MSPADPASPRDLTDRVLRQTLPHPDNLRAFLCRAVPELASGFDFARARLLEREYFLDDWRRREADLPFEIPYRTEGREGPALVFVLVEHQSATDTMLPLLMLSSTTAFWERLWRDWQKLPPPRPAMRLWPVLPLVLYTGDAPWGSNRTLADLLGEPATFHAFAPRWEPVFWNLADQTAEGLAAGGEGMLQLLAVMRAVREDEEAFRSLADQVLRSLGLLCERDRIRGADLLRAALGWMLARRPASERQVLIQTAVAGQPTPARQREVRDMAQTGAEAWIEEGVAKGIAQGRAEGEVQAVRAVLRMLLQDRFGTLPEAVVRQINSATDLARLQAAVRSAVRLERLDELAL